MKIDSDIENKAKDLAKWLKTQPHLPEQIGRQSCAYHGVCVFK